MSIRTALIGGICTLLLLSSGILALVGARAIRKSVVREAQTRVDHDLFLFASLYETELALTAQRLRTEVAHLEVAPETILGQPGSERERLGWRLLEVKRALDFAVLNITGPDGVPIPLSARDETGERGPVELDPVLRSALVGVPNHGTVLLSADRLRLEGGHALAASQRIPPPDGAPDGGTEDALFQWFAVPLLDGGGAVVGVVYGGRPINHNYELIDHFARTLFGERLHAGKPVGTVTIFLGETRVATNVRDASGNRALGTRVSDVVRDHVLGSEERWHDRAWVVDSWYLSGYQPLQEPTGRTVGMLYVGLLEAPYDELQTRMIRRFALPALILLGLAWMATILVVRRITRPLERLRGSADRVAAGDWERLETVGGSYREIASLSDALARMQSAIHRRDRDLRGKNNELSETNAKLQEANENYMSTLGFVTHELKAPLANVQSLIELVVDGYGGELNDEGRGVLVRIRRNCEELQGMVKDYLDLSRAERGGLVPQMRTLDLVADVIEPSATLVEGLFHSHRMQLEIAESEPLVLSGDAELLRIALTNLLNNAAKYGREGGRAVLEIRRDADQAVVGVWNEGAGFSPSDAESLFSKFSRLRNENTKSRKGSGLGLFLTAQIVEQHGGRVWAESDPGQWARFGFRLPLDPRL